MNSDSNEVKVPVLATVVIGTVGTLATRDQNNAAHHEAEEFIEKTEQENEVLLQVRMSAEKSQDGSAQQVVEFTEREILDNTIMAAAIKGEQKDLPYVGLVEGMSVGAGATTLGIFAVTACYYRAKKTYENRKARRAQKRPKSL